jgi:PAS domain S-box-containing protein
MRLAWYNLSRSACMALAAGLFLLGCAMAFLGHPWTALIAGTAGGIVVGLGAAQAVIARNDAQTAEALEERRLLLESIEVTPTPFALYDADDRLVASNSSYRDIHEPAFSQLPQPIHYRDLMLAVARQILPPEQVEAAVRERVATHRAGDGAPMDRVYPSGRWYRVHKVRTKSGAIAGFASDVTELKRREAELVAAEARVRDFAETASDWFWESDAALRLTFVSAKAGDQGFDTSRDLGRSLAEILVGSTDDPARAQAYRDTLNRREPFREVALTLTGKDGGIRHIALSAKPVVDAAGQFHGYRGVSRDITSAVSGAKALQAALERAEDASRTKSEFLANMSHELRTPLNAIIGFSDMMRSGLLKQDLARYESYAADINRSGLHLLELINDLLDLAKIEAGKMEMHDEPVDLPAMLADIQRMMRGQAERAGLSIEVAANTAVGYLLADERSLRQIVLNLVANALKFTPAGGKTTIAAGFGPDGTIRLTVSDTGIGIAPEDVARLMQPFVQVDSAYGRRHKGSGLGLALVRTLAELHGGRVSIDSMLGRGTTVHVDLPGWRGATAPALPKSAGA